MTGRQKAGAAAAFALAGFTLAGLLQQWYASAAPDPDTATLDDLHAAYGPSRYSQGYEETLVRAFFRDRRDGFFLDVGASHFQKDSTTFYLERELGWRGIAVDALE